jgi:hypothetical protein
VTKICADNGTIGRPRMTRSTAVANVTACRLSLAGKRPSWEAVSSPSSTLQHCNTATVPANQCSPSGNAPGNLGRRPPHTASHAWRGLIEAPVLKFDRCRPAPFQAVLKRGGLSSFPRS